jgi:hypothetical protein
MPQTVSTEKGTTGTVRDTEEQSLDCKFYCSGQTEMQVGGIFASCGELHVTSRALQRLGQTFAEPSAFIGPPGRLLRPSAASWAALRDNIPGPHRAWSEGGLFCGRRALISKEDGREADFLFIGSAQPILLPISYLRTDDSQGFESFRLI